LKRAFLIPGLGGTSDCWSDLFTGRLESCYKIETTDLPETGTTIAEFAADLCPEDPPDLLIGFSIGSAVVQEILCSQPCAFPRAVLMAPPAGNGFPNPPDEAHDFSDGRGKWSATMLELMFTPEWLAAHPDVTEFFPRVKKSLPSQTLIRQSNAIRNWEGCTERLAFVETKVLIIAGSYDIITPPVHARAINRSLPGSELSMLETGHGFPWQCPLETADRILEFTG